jgi:hypothetical protein
VAVDAVSFEVAPQPPGRSTRASSRRVAGKNVRAGADLLAAHRAHRAHRGLGTGSRAPTRRSWRSRVPVRRLKLTRVEVKSRVDRQLGQEEP